MIDWSLYNWYFQISYSYKIHKIWIIYNYKHNCDHKYIANTYVHMIAIYHGISGTAGTCGTASTCGTCGIIGTYGTSGTAVTYGTAVRCWLNFNAIDW